MGEPTGARKRAVKAVEMTVAQYLGLDAAESQLVELRVAIASEVRRRREALGMSQAELAGRLGVKQPRIPTIEAACSSLDAMLRAFFAVGGSLFELAGVAAEAARQAEEQARRAEGLAGPAGAA